MVEPVTLVGRLGGCVSSGPHPRAYAWTLSIQSL
jgi:hypothetical protein